MNNKQRGYHRQSAVIPYRKGNNGLEILLITSRTRQRWIIPKGEIESNMTAHDSAAKEALEEAGVTGKVSGARMGRFYCQKWGAVCCVDVFPLKVQKQRKTWLESRFRRRRWLSLKDAIKTVDHPIMKRGLARLPKAIK